MHKVGWDYKHKCHELFKKVFDNPGQAYRWLSKNYKVNHFRDLDNVKDLDLLRNIYDELFKMNILQ